MNIEITCDGVTHGRRVLQIGEVIDLDADSCNSLVTANLAKYCVAENATESPTSSQNDTGDKLPDGVVNDAPEGENEDGSGKKNENENADEIELGKLKKTLNDKFKRDELYDAAIKAGVDVAYDAKKAEIIDAIVISGKANILLK